MTIKEQAKKLAELLYKEGNGNVEFDWKSYDYKEDIPHLLIGNVRRMVSGFFITADGSEITVSYLIDEENVYSDYSFYTDFALDVDHEFADNEKHYEVVLESMDVCGLLNDAYYETQYSWDSGEDFDLFLKNGIKDEFFGSKTYNVTCTLIYNGSIQVSANSEEEAMEKADKVLSQINTHFDIPYFDFGECTIDYAEED